MKNKINIIIIFVLLLTLGGGIFGFIKIQKNHSQEKKQECSRNAVKYIENMNKKDSYHSILVNTSYYEGFCYLDYLVTNNEGSFAFISNIDQDKIISMFKIGDKENEEFLKIKKRIFK